MGESFAQDPIFYWKIWNWPSRLFVFYMLITAVLAVVTLVLLNRRARLLAHAGRATDLSARAELRAWDYCFQRLNFVSRLVAFNFLLCCFVSAGQFRRELYEVSHCWGCCTGGVGSGVYLFMLGIACCCVMYALYLFGTWQVARLRESWNAATEKEPRDRALKPTACTDPSKSV